MTPPLLDRCSNNAATFYKIRSDTRKTGHNEIFNNMFSSSLNTNFVSSRRCRRNVSFCQVGYFVSFITVVFISGVTAQINGTCSCLPSQIQFTVRNLNENCPGNNGGPGLVVNKDKAVTEFFCSPVNPPPAPPASITRVQMQEFRTINDTEVSLGNKVIENELGFLEGDSFTYEFSTGMLDDYPIESVDLLPDKYIMTLTGATENGVDVEQSWIVSLSGTCDFEPFDVGGFVGYVEFTNIVSPFAYLCPAFGFTFEPTGVPTDVPTSSAPTDVPTSDTPTSSAPTTSAPTDSPTSAPISDLPTLNPTTSSAPTASDATASPTNIPTDDPTSPPTLSPTRRPTLTPTDVPTGTPTQMPTDLPETDIPTSAPTDAVTDSPTGVPTSTPTNTDTGSPTGVPTNVPTFSPTVAVNDETTAPTEMPTSMPTGSPTCAKKDKKGGCKKDPYSPKKVKKDKKDKKDKKSKKSDKKDKKGKGGSKKEPMEPKKSKKRLR